VETSERPSFAADHAGYGSIRLSDDFPRYEARFEARFEWDLSADRWWWSDGMFAVHGCPPGSVEPTLDFLLGHQHPQDRARTHEAFTKVCEDGRPFLFEHRIVTPDNGLRTMILSVTAHVGPGSRPLLVAGTLLDVSDARRLHHAAEQDSIAGLQAELVRVSEAARTRELISQATGVLMERHKVTADEAAALLRRASQVAGRKLPDVASELLYTGKLVGDVSLSALHTPRSRMPVGKFPMRPAGVKGHRESA
jgi:hypothetical protein